MATELNSKATIAKQDIVKDTEETEASAMVQDADDRCTPVIYVGKMKRSSRSEEETETSKLTWLLAGK